VIVLVNPASTPSPRKPLPMSVLAVAAVLEGEFEYDIVDGNTERDPIARIVAVNERKSLTAVAMSVMPGPQLSAAVRLSRELKRRLPGVPIIWGGYFPSQHPDTVMRDGAVDYCIRGQGERAFVSLMRVLTKGGSFASIGGLSYSNNGRVINNPIAPLTSLDELPPWPY
jgi:anaerobic magnesium-protoporphyrin IX monomethyl ester cyclase